MSALAVSNNDGDVIDLSGSPPPSRRLKRTFGSCTARDSDVIVISDDEAEVDLKVPLTPVRRVLSNAQINVPAQQSVPGPSVVMDPLDTFMARVLEIVPDVSREHLRALLEEHYPIQGDSTVEAVLHVLFEDPSYPRSEKSAGKRRRVDVDEEGPAKSKVKIDYASKERPAPGAHYPALAMSQLLTDFPYIPKPHIRDTFASNRCLYAPAYLFLVEEAKTDKPPYKRKTIPSRVTGKGPRLYDAEFDKERAWLVDYLANPPDRTASAEEEPEEEDEECEDGIECGCCFSKYAFDKMIQCPEAHLFCRSCCRSYAANLLGQHDPRLHCMDQSGCKEMFPESELVRFLSPKLYALFQRVKQQKEIAAAGLEGLEECPFCEYKVVIENPDEKLFRCENTECEAVSCRACKKADHLPKSCKEVEEDKHLSVRHMIEEAMTKALMRNCPKCDKGFVKEHGCNKMTCPNCGMLSCYICRKVIIGYDHFGQPPPYTVPPDPNKCNLWDPVEQRHNNEVIEAAKKAVEEYKALHPDVSDEALNVDLPSPVRNPAPPAGPAYPAPNVVFGEINGHRLQMHLQQQQHLQQQHHAIDQRQAAIQQRAAEIQQQLRRDMEVQRRQAEVRHMERLQRSRENLQRSQQRAMVLRGHIAPAIPGASRPRRQR